LLPKTPKPLALIKINGHFSIDSSASHQPQEPSKKTSERRTRKT